MSIYTVMPKLAGEIEAVGKAHKNTHQNYRFKSIDDFMAVLNPLLAKHKVTLQPAFTDHSMQELKKGWRATCRLTLTWYAEDGTFITTSFLGEGIDYGDKATNKAMAAALKYAILQTLCVPTEERKDSEADASVNPTKASDYKSPEKSESQDSAAGSESEVETIDWAAKFKKCRKLDKLEDLGEKAAAWYRENNIPADDKNRQAALAEYQRKFEMMSDG